MELIRVLKAIGDENRLRILNLLKQGELCVCEIQYALDTTQSNTSRHLKNLSNAGLLISNKKAQWVSYSINEAIYQEFPFVQSLVETELNKLEFAEKDVKRLDECQQIGIPCEWNEK